MKDMVCPKMTASPENSLLELFQITFLSEETKVCGVDAVVFLNFRGILGDATFSMPGLSMGPKLRPCPLCLHVRGVKDLIKEEISQSFSLIHSALLSIEIYYVCYLWGRFFASFFLVAFLCIS